jgi:hypothetical protein
MLLNNWIYLIIIIIIIIIIITLFVVVFDCKFVDVPVIREWDSVVPASEYKHPHSFESFMFIFRSQNAIPSSDMFGSGCKSTSNW